MLKDKEQTPHPFVHEVDLTAAQRVKVRSVLSDVCAKIKRVPRELLRKSPW